MKLIIFGKFLLLFILLLLCYYTNNINGQNVQSSEGYLYIKPKYVFDDENVQTIQPYRSTNRTTALTKDSNGPSIESLIEQHKFNILNSIVMEERNREESLNLEPKNGFIRPQNRCGSCQCGVPNVHRIVGGNRVWINKYPWTAQLLVDDLLFCGGTLINDRYILTAAHCLITVNASDIVVRLLQLNQDELNQGIVRRVAYARAHRRYNRNSLQNDIALLRLKEPIQLGDNIRPSCLPLSLNHNFDKQEAIVAGWGYTSQNGVLSTFLQEVSVPILTNEQCQKTNYKSLIVDTMICAGLLEGGKDACQGDSGGPLVVHDGVYRLAGVVSFGFGCAQALAPGVYTRVSRYMNWISYYTRDACYCYY